MVNKEESPTGLAPASSQSNVGLWRAVLHLMLGRRVQLISLCTQGHPMLSDNYKNKRPAISSTTP